MKNLISTIFQKKVVVSTPIDSIVYNTSNFNLWFCDPNNNAVYANKGIFLRLDKLSSSHITDYLVKSYGITDFDYIKILEFENQIRKDWFTKINNHSHDI